jgi:hypothetical protein
VEHAGLARFFAVQWSFFARTGQVLTRQKNEMELVEWND